MDRGRVGEDRGSKETDRCPHTAEVLDPHLLKLAFLWLKVELVLAHVV
jgi:hypothetical protein